MFSLLLAVSVSIGSQVTPAQAATTVPEYGAPEYVNGSPVGGGDEYLGTIGPSQADYVVDTAAELKSALAAAASGNVVYVADGATITIASSSWYGVNSSGIGTGCYLKAGVTLAGGRGRAGVTGGIIRVDPALQPTSFSVLIWCAGSGCRVTGLTLVGAQDGTTGDNMWCGVWAGDNANIDNNEIHGFGCAGVRVDRNITGVWVHHNYIHHNQQTGSGYGVYVNAYSINYVSSVVVEGNHFDSSRHHIAASHGKSSYIFRYNYLGANCTNTQIDCHGNNDGGTGDLDKDAGGEYIYPAGEHIEIYNNTSLNTTQPLVKIRGTPYSGGFVSVHNNWSYLPSTYIWSYENADGTRTYLGPICQVMYRVPEYGYSASNNPSYSYGPFVRMEEHDNWWGTTAPPSTNRAPVLNAIGNRAVVELATLSFTISATDPDGDTLTYTASNLPQGASFDPLSRTFSWTPEDGQAGVYANIHFQVSDGSLGDSEYITITVSDGAQVIQADVNSDGSVNSLDMIRIGQHWNETGTAGWIPEDVNKDGMVNVLDATLIGQYWTV